MSDAVDVNALSQWLSNCEQIQQPSKEITLRPASGDAGHRQYFYIETHPDLLAVYAPPQHINSEIFVELAHYLREEGIFAPRVYAFDQAQGFLLIENFGDTLLLTALDTDSVESLYAEALLTLMRMQQAPYNKRLLEDYDSEKLRAEMDLFPEWFVTGLLGYTLNNDEQHMLQEVFRQLIDSALEQPTTFVHRDYHSRNLIHRPIGPPGVIDFQDAVWGPFTYDVVSLLKDCYVRWPTESVNRWARAYATMLISAGIIAPVPAQQLQRWFDWMGLQRHIKVLGIFARLYLRDSKSAYLHDLPLVMRYTLEAASDYPELQEFKVWFESNLLPLCEQQSWYHDFRNAGFCPAEH